MPPLSQHQISERFAKAQTAMRAGQLFLALDLMTEIATARPNAPEPLWHLGRLNLRLGRPKSARMSLEKALKLSPDAPPILSELASALSRTGDEEAALACLDKMIQAAPKDIAPKMDKVLMLQQFGRLDDANALCRKLLPKLKADAEFYRIWFASERFNSKRDTGLRDAIKLWNTPNLGDKARLHLGFALARAFEALGEDESMLKVLAKANALQAKLAPYDAAARDTRIAATCASAAEGTIDRTNPSDFAPIIIAGMPRTGTTLIEQILAAHPDVRAGGEIGQALQMAQLTFGATLDAPIEQLDPSDVTLFAERYEASAKETAIGDAPRVTDKSIQNHLILGHIAAAFPKARFIVVRRDPRDTALSIYKNHFALGTHRYACRFEDIAHQMKGFEQAIAYWSSRIPLTEISYDELTHSPEQTTRALVEAAGLPWHDACLDHTSSKQTVTTLSLAQVRKPIYKSSSGGWRRFEGALEPFIKAWDAQT